MYFNIKSLDDKCYEFHSLINKSVVKSIPSHVVSYSDKDKPWITPVTKHLINQRWKAYRCGNFPIYHHLKMKIKLEIKKSKLIWAKKSQYDAKSAWNSVNVLLGKNFTDPLARLYNSFPAIPDAAAAINFYFGSIFTNTSKLQFDIVDDGKWCP